ncbi:MAG: 16S rRNA (cytosine(967)-C(5))-methyltransferase RsmB [Ruminococcaceae bacterium]|nr:16S rRNA (cytosine(967)-C(5))-methyltransferase RsmB [Oscillospiraceae bacterium]
MKNSRLTAFEILYDIEKNSAYSNIALDSAIKDFEPKDKAFISSLVLGVVERRITLDYLIKPYLSGKTKPKVKLILYIGAYQLYFMDKVPSSAAINTSVELASQTGVSYYKNLINAVLHKVDNNRIDINTLDDLSVRYSVPQNLINFWKKMYGDEQCEKLLSVINTKPPVFAVPNKMYVDAEELSYELLNSGVDCEVEGELVKINSSFNLSALKPFKDGLFHIQDKSSFECAKALEAKAGDTVLDICSAPGGKAFTIAEDMNNCGKVYAFDIYEHRVGLIKSGAERLGLDIIDARVNDAEVLSESIPSADKILCDVPCSGFGIIRRKPEIRYKELDTIKELPALQLKILETSSAYLRDDSRLVYSTCTLNKRENENVVRAFLDNHSEFKLIKEKTIFPSEYGGDGFYFAVLEN